jgi:hypothetical protein
VDFDADGDVDQSDFGHLQACYTDIMEPIPTGCSSADLDGSGTIDLLDCAEFEPCVGGAGQPPACSAP